MLIIGCDFHTRYQQIAMLDEAQSHFLVPGSATAQSRRHSQRLFYLTALGEGQRRGFSRHAFHPQPKTLRKLSSSLRRLAREQPCRQNESRMLFLSSSFLARPERSRRARVPLQEHGFNRAGKTKVECSSYRAPHPREVFAFPCLPAPLPLASPKFDCPRAMSPRPRQLPPSHAVMSQWIRRLSMVPSPSR